MLNGCIIKWVDNIDYLGVKILSAKVFKCCWNNRKKKFYRSVNMIFGRLGLSTDHSVLIKLVNTNAFPVLLYGTIATTLSSADLKDLEHAYDSVFNKLYRSFDKKIILQCQFYSGCWPLGVTYDYNRLVFLTNLIKKIA